MKNCFCVSLKPLWIPFVLFAFLLAGCSDSSNATHSGQGLLDVGTEGRIVGGGNRETVVGSSEQSEADLNTAAAANDKAGYSSVVDQGRAFLVADGTQSKIVGYGSGVMGASVYHVRVESGPFAGRDGWIPMEWFSK